MSKLQNDPELYFAEDGAPRSGRFNDIYYSLEDGLNESRAVFFAGCHLPEAWSHSQDFCVLELGFGTGLNIAALIQLWVAKRPRNGRLHVFSVEAYPIEAEQARQALASWPELNPFADEILRQWPKSRTGLHYMDFPLWGVSLTLALVQVTDALSTWDGRVDAIFLDGFSPALNPEMWSDAVFSLLAQKAHQGTRLATFTVAGAVRRGLAKVGFVVEKRPGFGRKRERLEGVYLAGSRSAPDKPCHKVAIIGAGIAGCALAYQAKALGIDFDIFEQDGIGSGASGNIAALVTPRLDAGDNPISALFADAFAYARALYLTVCPDAITGAGVSQLEATARDASRFERINRQTGYTESDLTLFCAGQLVDVPDRAGISLNTALWVQPTLVLKGLLGTKLPIKAQIVDWRRNEDAEITLVTNDGSTFEAYDAVIVACGNGVFDLGDLKRRLDLRPVRGQMEIVTCQEKLDTALSWGGYAIPRSDGFIFGATHEREDRGCEPRDTDRARNVDSLATVMPQMAEAARVGRIQSRASIRVMTRDYLPLIGEFEPGMFLMTGLGSRGFCVAPLLAKALLAQVLNLNSPLSSVAKKLLNLSRMTQD